MVRIRSPFFSIQSLFNDLDEILYPEVDKKDSVLIDTYKYSEGKLSYVQRVYRLKDHSIYVENEQIEDRECATLKKELEDAIKNQNFEYAAVLRDKILNFK